MPKRAKIKYDVAILAFFALLSLTFAAFSTKLAVESYKAPIKQIASVASANLGAANSAQNDTAQNNTQNPTRTNIKIPFVPTEADAYVIYDASSKTVLSSKNNSKLLPLASLTKVFTAILALETLGKESVITIKPSDLETEGESGLKANSHWKVKELVPFMLVVSSNDAATALARAMQEKTGKSYKKLFKELANKLGAKSAFALNPSGLDESINMSGAYASAEDVAKAVSYAARKHLDVFEKTTKTQLKFYDEDGNEYKAKNTNQAIEFIFNPLLSKTGFTDLAGGNLAIAFELEPGHTIAIVVLASSKEGRFKDVEKLYKATIQYLSQ